MGTEHALQVPTPRNQQIAPLEMAVHSASSPGFSRQTTTDMGVARLNTPEARSKAAETLAFKRNLLEEDVLLLRERGLVPLAIADELDIALRRVVKILQESGYEVPRYLITSGEPKKSPDDVCELRRALNG